MSPTSMQKQTGVALIIVLLIVALVVILAAEMGGRLQLNIQRIQNIKDSNQAQWYAFSAESFAEKSLKDLYEQSNENIHIGQPWSQEFTFPLDGGGIQAQLVDMQSCFNLNALASNSATPTPNTDEPTAIMEAFRRVLTNVPRDEAIEGFVLDTVRDSLADWLDQDDRTRDFGAEDNEYESRQFPYLAANNLMASQTEFRLINGVSAEWINDLWEFICVIPNSNRLLINVNTITTEKLPLLAGLTGLSLSEAGELLSRRPSDGWSSIGDFFAENLLQNATITDEQRSWFNVTTEYFILHTKTRYNNAVFSMSSLFYVQNASSISVIRREFGGTK